VSHTTRPCPNPGPSPPCLPMPVVVAAAAAGPMDMASSSSSGTAGRSSFASLWWSRRGQGRTCGNLAPCGQGTKEMKETNDDEAWKEVKSLLGKE